jgi:hypothetical protein
MANPSKQKGTGGETELVNLLNARYGNGEAPAPAERMPNGWTYDVRMWGADGGVPLELLAGRADRKGWFVTLPLNDFLDLYDMAQYPPDLHFESKRYAHISWHGIWEKKFGGKA